MKSVGDNLFYRKAECHSRGAQCLIVHQYLVGVVIAVVLPGKLFQVVGNVVGLQAAGCPACRRWAFSPRRCKLLRRCIWDQAPVTLFWSGARQRVVSSASIPPRFVINGVVASR